MKRSAPEPAVEAKQTLMKATHAAHMVDKNSRTIAKILQLLVNLILILRYLYYL
jgi:hypothetical protein